MVKIRGLFDKGDSIRMCLSCSIVAIHTQATGLERVIKKMPGNSQSIIDFTRRINEAFLCLRNKGVPVSEQSLNNLHTKIEINIAPLYARAGIAQSV
jgi:hypothetical protein